MAPLNHDALRMALASDFSARSHNIRGAAQVGQILEELSKSTKNILSELASQWNHAHTLLCRLPPEVLAMCFSPLDLRDAISVSHVSRHWRAVALSHQALWCRIYLKRTLRDAPAYAQMLLSRTRNYPIDFRGEMRLQLNASAVHAIASCLAEHMGQLRDITWYFNELDLPYSLPAPFLQRLWAVNCDLAIPADFLGGRPGRLDTLVLAAVCFPTTCPALSTLRHLYIEFKDSDPRIPERAASFSRIFDLCPRLKSLALRNIELEDGDFLPTTPAPLTLSRLELETKDPYYDLIEHYIDWKHQHNLSDVSLRVDESTLGICSLRDLVFSCVKLLVLKDGYATRIVAHGPSELTARSITFSPSEPYYSDIIYADVGFWLCHAHAALDNVEFLGIRLAAVAHFVGEDVFSHLPKLAILHVAIDEISSYDSGWDPLVVSLISVAAQPCPCLTTLRLSFNWRNGDRPLDAVAAHQLLAAFERNSPTLPDICILGFEPDAVRDVQIPNMDGCRIEFGGTNTEYYSRS